MLVGVALFGCESVSETTLLGDSVINLCARLRVIWLGIALLCHIFPCLWLGENTYTVVQYLAILLSHSCNNVISIPIRGFP